MNKFKELLKPLRRKITVDLTVNYAILGFSTGLILSIAVILVSKFVYVKNIALINVTAILIGILIGIIVAFIKRPSYYKVASIGDSLGFKERFVTAFELITKGSMEINEQLVIKDAYEKAKQANFKKLYKIKAPKRKLQVTLILVVALMVSGYMPVVKADEISKQIEVTERVNEEIKKIEEASKAAQKDVTNKKAQQINKRVNELIKELKKSSSEADAIKNIQKAQQELKKLSNDSLSKDLKDLGSKLTQYKTTKNLGEALVKGDMQAYARERQNFADKIQNASDKEKEEIIKDLKEFYEELAKDSELRDAVSEFHEMLERENLEDVNNALNNLDKQIESLVNESDELKEAINKLNEALSESSNSVGNQNGQQSGSQSSQTSQSGQNMTGQSGNQSNQQNQSGNSQNGQSGQSSSQGSQQNQSGSQSSQGQGQGQTPSQGTGDSATSGGTGNSASQNSGGNGRGTGHIENENIYSRAASGFEDFEANVTGQQNQGGTMEEQQVTGMGNVGKNVPYSEVIGQYSNQELKSLEEFEIPHGMKELVKDYFSTLE